MTDTPPRAAGGDLSPPQPERLASPIPDHTDLALVQRLLSEKFGYDVDIEKYIELITDPTQWDMPAIRQHTGVPRQTLGVWRLKSRRGVTVPLPPEEGVIGQSPWWHAGTIRRRFIWAGLVRPDGVPMRPKGPGRPPKQRDQ